MYTQKKKVFEMLVATIKRNKHEILQEGLPPWKKDETLLGLYLESTSLSQVFEKRKTSKK